MPSSGLNIEVLRDSITSGVRCLCHALSGIYDTLSARYILADRILQVPPEVELFVFHWDSSFMGSRCTYPHQNPKTPPDSVHYFFFETELNLHLQNKMNKINIDNSSTVLLLTVLLSRLDCFCYVTVTVMP